MKIIEPTFEILDHNNLLRNIELAGRTCYKSEDKMGEGSDERLIEKLKSLKHESVFEHGVISVKFVTDRGVTHELVRHRLAAFSQESTRYCNYSKDKFGNEITVINPFFFDPMEERRHVRLPLISFKDEAKFGGGREIEIEDGIGVEMNSLDIWLISCLVAEWGYNTLIEQFGKKPQEARSVLPNSLKTEIVVTANVREWRHILRMRTSHEAHPQIRQIMVPLAHTLASRWPILFGDFSEVEHVHPAQEVFSA